MPTRTRLKRMQDNVIVIHLVEARGKERWTAKMLLIINFGPLEDLPVSDLGIRRRFMRATGAKVMLAPEKSLSPGERWRPDCSVASGYLWRASELPD